VSAIGHYLESAGLPTVSISLIRAHTERMRPPRALWVPYELGRPLGVPNDAAFQTRVLRAALGLLERTDGPFIVDHAEDAPKRAADDADDGMFCPVSFPAPAADESPSAILKREIASLKPWQALAVEHIAAFAEGTAPAGSALEGVPSAEAFKRMLDDLLAFYQEAATAQPGQAAGFAEVSLWFWGDTQAGKLLLACRDRALEGDDAELRFITERLMVPRVARERLNL